MLLEFFFSNLDESVPNLQAQVRVGSHPGHENVHREVEETSGFGSEITKAQEAVAQAKLTKEEEALEDGLKRLNSLQQEADGLSEQPPPPAAPAEFCKRVGRIECLCPSTPSREGRSSNVESRPRNARSLAVPSPGPRDGILLAIRSGQFIQCDGDPHRPSRFECQVEPSVQSDVAEWHRSISGW